MIDQNAILFHSSNDMLGNLFEEKDEDGLNTINDNDLEDDEDDDGLTTNNNDEARIRALFERSNTRNMESAAKIPLNLVNQEDLDERETLMNTDEEPQDELCISMLLRDDPKLTVIIYLSYSI